MTSGKGFRLKDHDPADTMGHLLSKPQAEAMLAHDVHRLAALQEKLYAQNEWAMLCVLQAMDAAGKDGTIKHVMSGVNPQGVRVTSFKAPGPEELAHDFLWRANRALPERGHIGIFNRSHYEEVLVVRVHPEVLERQHLPDEVLGKRMWDQRLEAIAAFERYLTRQGMVVLKFFLNVSRGEQKRRFLERLEEKDKHWKFSAGDLAERAFWDDYQHAYEEAIAATADAARAVVRGAGGQQVVHAADRGGRDDRGAGGTGPDAARAQRRNRRRRSRRRERSWRASRTRTAGASPRACHGPDAGRSRCASGPRGRRPPRSGARAATPLGRNWPNGFRYPPPP